MRHYFDRFLLGALWIIATVLCACFWFNIRFEFDIFSRAHWKYLADVQVESASVSPWFYISLIIFCFIALAGLYLIFYYGARKISFGKPAGNIHTPIIHRPEPQIAQPTVSAPLTPAPPTPTPAPPRPPKLSIPLSQQPRPLPQPMPHQSLAPAPIQKQPVIAAQSNVSIELEERVREIAMAANFIVKAPPSIGGVRPNLWALGSDEVLVVGLIFPAHGDITAQEGGVAIWKSGTQEFESPVWRLTAAVEKLRALFTETLDAEINITIRPFVVLDGGNITNADKVRTIWNAFGINVFQNTDELAEFMQDHPNRDLRADEQGDFDAYVEYIDTVADYFNNQ